MKNLNLIIFALLIIKSVFSYSQSINKEEYLKNNSFDIKDKLLFNDNLVYLAGEIHYSKGNYDNSKTIIEHLSIESNKKVIIIFELPYNRELYFNKFFLIGDTTSLNILAEDTYLVDEFKKNMWELKKIRDSQMNKFEIKCIDIAKNLRNAFSNIERLINEDDLNLPAFIKFLKFNNRKYMSKWKAKKMLLELREESSRNETTYKSYFGENYNEFQRQIDAGLILFSGFNTKTSESMESREQFLYNNCKRIIEENKDCILFGQFGQAHIPLLYQKNWLHLNNWSSLAARLNSDSNSPVKGKVTSMVYFYKTDYIQNSYFEPIIKSEDVPVFMKYSNSPFTIFKLDAPETPFKEMSEKYQYLIINKY
jgi:calcineurin-like phosphoesterase family protein